MASSNFLRSSIQGWGADLDPKDRPGVPREKTPLYGTGAHWREPERQVPNVKILVSPEHKGLTPVFGTTCPPRGLSGKIREYAFTFSEGRTLHWALLLFADRVDVFENSLKSIFTLKAHNPLSEMGLIAEFKRHGLKSRWNKNRSDVRRVQKQLLIFSFFTAVISYRIMRLSKKV